MKVIFLDIDGVLNCERFYVERCARRDAAKVYPITEHDQTDEFCPQLVANLNRITDATGAKLVISSTWRSDGIEALTDLFKAVGITGEIISTTGYDRNRHRGTEIQAWLGKQIDEPQYIVIDDDGDMLPHQPLIKCSFKTGLTPELAEQAIAALS